MVTPTNTAEVWLKKSNSRYIVIAIKTDGGREILFKSKDKQISMAAAQRQAKKLKATLVDLVDFTGSVPA